VIGDERLTANVRVRLTASERRDLDAAAKHEQRSASAIARRAIRRELLAVAEHGRRKGRAGAA
jgi:hypothetical protein